MWGLDFGSTISFWSIRFRRSSSSSEDDSLSIDNTSRDNECAKQELDFGLSVCLSLVVCWFDRGRHNVASRAVRTCVRLRSGWVGKNNREGLCYSSPVQSSPVVLVVKRDVE